MPYNPDGSFSLLNEIGTGYACNNALVPLLGADLDDIADALSNSLRDKLDQDTTFFVSTTGSNDTGDGSEENPWLTGQNAIFQILHRYDGGGNTITLQLVGSPFNVPNGESFAYFGWPGVGMAQIVIRGNPANPSDFVIDGSLNPGDGVAISLGPTGFGASIRVDGVTLQNFQSGINVQTSCFLDIGAVTFIDNEDDIHVEAGGTVSGRDGAWTFSGSHGQMIFCAGSSVDTNGSPIIFDSNPSFSFVIFNVDLNGSISFYNNVTGTCTGPRAFISRSAALTGVTADGSSFIPYSNLPGNSDGLTNGGWYNNSQLVPAIAVGSLPSLPGDLTGGERFMVNNANSTTFASIVAAGGANVVPVYNDGAGNWRIG